jgi:hypothetical protein
MAEAHARTPRRRCDANADVRLYVDLCDAASDVIAATDISRLEAVREKDEVSPQVIALAAPPWLLPRPMLTFLVICSHLWRSQGFHAIVNESLDTSSSEGYIWQQSQSPLLSGDGSPPRPTSHWYELIAGSCYWRSIERTCYGNHSSLSSLMYWRTGPLSSTIFTAVDKEHLLPHPNECTTAIYALKLWVIFIALCLMVRSAGAILEQVARGTTWKAEVTSIVRRRVAWLYRVLTIRGNRTVRPTYAMHAPRAPTVNIDAPGLISMIAALSEHDVHHDRDAESCP